MVVTLLLKYPLLFLGSYQNRNNILGKKFEGISLFFGVRFLSVNTLKEKLKIHFL